MERYHRQGLIEGWNQDKINKTNVVLIGSDKLSDFVLVDLLSMGFGNIKRLGYSDFFEFEKINPAVYIEQRDEELSSLQLTDILVDDADFVIDATNKLESKVFSSSVAKNKDIKYISACSKRDGFSLYLEELDNKLVEFHQDYYDSKQGITNSIICSGFLVDELRKRVFSLKNDTQMKNFTFSEIKEYSCLEKKILQVGAGAIGTFSALALAMMNADVTILDFDVIEDANLNRQFLFYGSIGLNKAIVLANRLNKYCKNIKGIGEKIDKNFDPSGYDFVLSCVDNNEARYYMNIASMRYNIPLINGGSSLSAGHAMPYVSGKTACLDCQTGWKLSEAIEEKKKREKIIGRCFQPSLIISNQIVGGLVIDTLNRVIQGRYEKSNYLSGSGIYIEEVNRECYSQCNLKEI